MSQAPSVFWVNITKHGARKPLSKRHKYACERTAHNKSSNQLNDTLYRVKVTMKEIRA